MAADTVPHRLFQQAKTRPDAPAYFRKVAGTYRAASFRDYAALVRRAGRALIALGVPAGGSTAILGYNRPEWVVMDVATMCVGGAPAGIYTTCSASEVRYITHHVEARVALVENAHQWGKIEQELENLPHLEHVVLMDGAPRIIHPKVMSWEEFLERGDSVADERLQERIDAL